ncbi:MAG TPA: OB-fold domain-containing protein [Thermoplasmata archaeon]|nr:OB-fold domain-containing protein [Thermoplasmata archaeon]
MTTGRLHSIEEFQKGYETEGRLLGLRSACGFIAATWLLACPRCGQRDLAEVELSGKGTVAAFSVQNVPSDEFLNDAPYAYVVVDLDEGGRLTGWIPGIASDAELSIGDRVHFVPGYRPGVQFQKG